jgi:hypothetical protein
LIIFDENGKGDEFGLLEGLKSCKRKETREEENPNVMFTRGKKRKRQRLKSK